MYKYKGTTVDICYGGNWGYIHNNVLQNQIVKSDWYHIYVENIDISNIKKP